MLDRAPVASSIRQPDRLPVSEYTDAVQALSLIRANPDVNAAGFDACVKLIADIYWRNDRKVRADVIRESVKLGLN